MIYIYKFGSASYVNS